MAIQNFFLTFQQFFCIFSFYFLLEFTSVQSAVVFHKNLTAENLNGPAPPSGPSNAGTGKESTIFKLGSLTASKRTEQEPEDEVEVARFKIDSTNDKLQDEDKNGSGKNSFDEPKGYWVPAPLSHHRINEDRHYHQDNFDESNNVVERQHNHNHEDEDEDADAWNSVDLWIPHERRKQNGEFTGPFVQDEPNQMPLRPLDNMGDDKDNEEPPPFGGAGEESEDNDDWRDSRSRRILYRVMESVNAVCSTLFPFVEAMGGERFCVKNPSTQYLGDGDK